MLEKFLIAGASALVSGGIAWGMAKAKIEQLRRDVNNLGSLRRQDVNGVGQKINRLEIVTLMYCPAEKRESIGTLFLESGK